MRFWVDRIHWFLCGSNSVVSFRINVDNKRSINFKSFYLSFIAILQRTLLKVLKFDYSFSDGYKMLELTNKCSNNLREANPDTTFLIFIVLIIMVFFSHKMIISLFV